jgi:endogenous inhibitor of DNA gyrase (YacG/DUF329 family)
MAQSKPLTEKSGSCPICGRPTDAAYRPFCSRRCADVDLSRWLRGGYAIPGAADADEDGDEPASPDPKDPDRN